VKVSASERTAAAASAPPENMNTIRSFFVIPSPTPPSLPRIVSPPPRPGR
jgi:hypothetical protein